MQIRLWFSFVVVLMIPAFSLAQNTEAESQIKEKQRRQELLIEQIIADVPNLKLGENRAFVYATVGNIVWKNSPAVSQAFFETAIAELANAQAAAEASRKTVRANHDLLTSQLTRPQILNIIARRDAEIALDALVKTRPAAVIDALRIQAGRSQKVSNYTNNNYLALNELNLEQSFQRMAAEQKPERAAKLLKDSLKKGFSHESLNLIKKLHEKDPAGAAEIASEIVDKIAKSKFRTASGQPDSGALNAASGFLTEFIRERDPDDKSFKFDDVQMRGLADRLIAFHLDQGNAGYGHYIGTIIQIAEKLSPGSVDRLKRIQQNYSGFGHDFDPDLQKLLSSDISPEQLLADAKRFPVNSRAQVFQTVANKYAQAGNVDRARQVLEENFSDGALEGALHSLEYNTAYALQNAGKFAEVERLIEEMPEIHRYSALINLANTVFDRDPVENRAYALALLGKARGLIGEKPENNHEMSILIQLATSYARIDADQAFRSLESMLPQINEITNASIVVSAFQGNSSIRQGEVFLTQEGSFGVHLDHSVFQALSKTDFERTVNLINGFSRLETRLRLRLQLAESGLH